MNKLYTGKPFQMQIGFDKGCTMGSSAWVAETNALNAAIDAYLAGTGPKPVVQEEDCGDRFDVEFTYDPTEIEILGMETRIMDDQQLAGFGKRACIVAEPGKIH